MVSLAETAMPAECVRPALDPASTWDAARRLKGAVVETPVLTFPALDRLASRRVLVKMESLQKGGSFKFRGAFNALLAKPRSFDRVVAYSSGNHAIAVAMACEALGLQATLVVPADAPAMKLALIREAGGAIVPYDRDIDDRRAIAVRIATQTSALLVPSFDDEDVIAGQGSVALELIEATKAAGMALERILVPCGGGGLVAGTCLAVAHTGSRTIVTAVEPRGFERVSRSLRAGHPVRNAGASASLCDALLSPQPSLLLLGLEAAWGLDAVVADDEAVATAVRFAFEQLKLVLEPSGAIGLAALLAGCMPAGDGPVGVICSGGNVDGAVFRQCLERGREVGRR